MMDKVELIDRAAVIATLERRHIDCEYWDVYGDGVNMGLYIAAKCLEDSPTIDAAPVRRGEWVEEMEAIPWCEDDCDVYERCSVCGETSHGMSNFCPNCGADMRRVSE